MSRPITQQGKRARTVILCAIALAALTGVLVTSMSGRATVQPAIRTVAINQGSFGAVVSGAAGRAVLDGLGRLQILDLRTGALLSIAPPAALFTAPLASDERSGRLFVALQTPAGISAGRIVMLDATNGRLLRTIALPIGAGVGQLNVDVRRGRVYATLVPTSGRRLAVLVLDAANGRIIRAITVTTAGTPSPPDTGRYALDVNPDTGQVYVTEGDDGVVHGLDGATGRQQWRAVLGVSPAVPDNNPTIRPPLVEARTGRLFVFNYRTGMVGVLDARTGRRVGFVREPPGGIDMVACRRTGRVFVFHGGVVDVLDATSGRLKRTAPIGASAGLGPAVVDERDGRIFLSDALTGSVVVLDGRDGRVIRRVVVGGFPSQPVVVERLGLALVSTTGRAGALSTMGNESGSVRVLDGRGALVRSWTVGKAPGAMAVDEQGGRAIVVNLNGSDLGPGPDPWGWVPDAVRRRLPIPPPPRPRTLPASVSILDLSAQGL